MTKILNSSYRLITSLIAMKSQQDKKEYKWCCHRIGPEIDKGDSPDDGAHVASPSGEQVQLNALAATAMLTLQLQQLLLLLLLVLPPSVISRRVMQLAFARTSQHLLPVQQEVTTAPERLEEGPAISRAASTRGFRWRHRRRHRHPSMTRRESRIHSSLGPISSSRISSWRNLALLLLWWPQVSKDPLLIFSETHLVLKKLFLKKFSVASSLMIVSSLQRSSYHPDLIQNRRS